MAMSSVKKRVIRNAKKGKQNKMRVSRMRSIIVKFNTLIKAKDKDGAKKQFPKTQSKIASEGGRTMPKKTASRKISRLSKANKKMCQGK
ncbi:MAG: 30S ribosomal protein S20 [Alphaproteobacteria bacterium]|nr:30S ribosomal protein S20 [Alphaproteobacteria bacterium]MBL0717964.1 30S ribosomal protein S20 [Alphaproteobacteria bacterium]